jgi:hypothetical protein
MVQKIFEQSLLTLRLNSGLLGSVQGWSREFGGPTPNVENGPLNKKKCKKFKVILT